MKGPAEPVVALLGADATLPCQLSPEQSAAHMHIRWYRAHLSPAVLVHQDGQEHDGEQMLEYRGRAELVADSMGKGAVALLIRHVRAADNGQYRCYFKDGPISQEAAVELHVIGMLTWHRQCMSFYKAKRKVRASGSPTWHFCDLPHDDVLHYLTECQFSQLDCEDKTIYSIHCSTPTKAIFLLFGIPKDPRELIDQYWFR